MNTDRINELIKTLFNSLNYDEQIEILNCLRPNYVSSFGTKPMCSKYLYTDKTSCEKAQYFNTNPDFPNFKQTIFHAGSWKQFNEYGLSKLIKNDRYQEDLIKNTFDYLFTSLKKGIFIQIVSNRIHIFLPFANASYKNTWSHTLKVPPTYKRGQILSLKINSCKNERLKTNYKKSFEKVISNKKVDDIVAFSLENEIDSLIKKNLQIDQNVSRWYANGCFFRNTVYFDKISGSFLVDEGDKTVANILVLLTEVLSNRTIKDTCLFVNPRDFPILKKDRSHPYTALGLGPEKITDKKLMKIYSQSTGPLFSDIAIPNDDDIVNILKVITRPSCKEPVPYFEPIEWSSKIEIAVFRGSATGCGLTERINKRIQLAFISKMKPTYVDACLTGLNYKLKKDPLNDYCDYIDEDHIIDKNLFKELIKTKRVKKFQNLVKLEETRVAIIVPYREQKQLEQFIEYMTTFMRNEVRPDLFKIFIIEQGPDPYYHLDNKFNRGSLLNIGFEKALIEGFNIFIFHDVFLLPSKELAPYYKMNPDELSGPIHIAKCWTTYFGGIVSFSRDQFIDIDGYPNIYWFSKDDENDEDDEDNELRRRVLDLSLKINGPPASLKNCIENIALEKNEILDTVYVRKLINEEHIELRKKRDLAIKNGTKVPSRPLWYGLSKPLEPEQIIKTIDLTKDVTKITVNISLNYYSSGKAHWSNQIWVPFKERPIEDDIIRIKDLTIPTYREDQIKTDVLRSSKEKDSWLSDKTQASFKYIIYCEGHVAAFRLTRLLSWSSVILYIESSWTIWYYDLLKMNTIDTISSKTIDQIDEQCVLIKVKDNIIDSTNLIETIDWLRKNDEISKKIATNGLNFYKRYLNKEYMLDYVSDLFNNNDV